MLAGEGFVDELLQWHWLQSVEVVVILDSEAGHAVFVMDALGNLIDKLVGDFARRASELFKVDRAGEPVAGLLVPLEAELIRRPLVLRQLDLLLVDLDYGFGKD